MGSNLLAAPGRARPAATALPNLAALVPRRGRPRAAYRAGSAGRRPSRCSRRLDAMRSTAMRSRVLPGRAFVPALLGAAVVLPLVPAGAQMTPPHPVLRDFEPMGGEIRR